MGTPSRHMPHAQASSSPLHTAGGTSKVQNGDAVATVAFGASKPISFRSLDQALDEVLAIPACTARESKHMPVWDPSMRNDPPLLHVICLQYHCPALTLIRRSTACSADMCLPQLPTHISIHLPLTELPSLHSLWICREAQDEECAERASAAVHTSKAVKENRHLASRSCLHESMRTASC